jgi:hypothetical protein
MGKGLDRGKQSKKKEMAGEKRGIKKGYAGNCPP